MSAKFYEKLAILVSLLALTLKNKGLTLSMAHSHGIR
ncbi:MAG: hypothetical protein BWY72_02321 [Bacteroidetes bacterium ADurb.Bin416]|jgi:hypothetical protein|nr:MAG: hypothetical protein BWY72_02321 [Bacteroidetes bacterium ADurb.Bin416]